MSETTHTAPGPVEPNATAMIPVRGGSLYAEHFVPDGTPRGIVIVSHGYAEHCGRYREVAHVIKRAGWLAMTYDVRGHGKSVGRRGFVDHFGSYLEDFAAVLAAGRALVANDAKLLLLGHSHGSLITLRALCDERPPMRVTAAIVSSPFLALRLKVPAWKVGLARVASVLIPTLAMPNDLHAEQLTHDVAMQQARVADTVCFDIATARWYTECLAAQAYVADHADRISVPTTWLVGADDPIADPAQSRRVATKVPSANYTDLVGMRHEVFNEVDRASVFDRLNSVLAAV